MTKIWKTKNGIEIPIEKMETSHIKNSINMMLKNGFCSAKEWNNLLKYDSFSDDEFGYDLLENSSPSSLLDMLYDELQNRGENDNQDEN